MKQLNYLKKLINIKIYDLNDNKEIIDELKLMFSAIAQDIMVIKNTVNNKESLLVGVNCKLQNVSDAIVLSGHIDTVCPRHEWKF